jgi:tryptophan synthase alpha chain
VNGLGRIAGAFGRARAEGRPALVTYVMGGDPSASASARLALACAAGGADILELGVPFSDPIADGPTIQRAAERALAAGATVTQVLEVARAVRRKTDVPLVLMGYVNPMLALGWERFLDGCVKSGVDGLIVPDLPPEEAAELRQAARIRGMATVFLLAPTSTPARRAAVLAATTGFVYFVSVTGVTGSRAALPSDLGTRLDEVRAQSLCPVVVGFGVSSGAQVRALGSHADGVVVGSAIVARGAERGSPSQRAARVQRFVHSLRR